MQCDYGTFQLYSHTISFSLRGGPASLTASLYKVDPFTYPRARYWHHLECGCRVSTIKIFSTPLWAYNNRSLAFWLRPTRRLTRSHHLTCVHPEPTIHLLYVRPAI